MPNQTQNLSDQLTTVTGLGNLVPLYQLNPVDGDARVPGANNVKLLGSTNSSGVTAVAIGWLKPSDALIDRFEIWVQRTAYTNTNPYLAASTVDSPASFQVTSDQNTVCIATIVTVLKNGLRSDFKSSPTVTFNVFVVSTTQASTLHVSNLGVDIAIDSVQIGGVGQNIEAVEVQDSTSKNTTTQTTDGFKVYNGDPSLTAKIAASMTNDGFGRGQIKAANGTQTGQLDSAGTRVLLDGNTGDISMNGTFRLTTTLSGSATAGAATLPAQPTGFLQVVINGVTSKIPVYNN